jgi:hypothetical protein
VYWKQKGGGGKESEKKKKKLTKGKEDKDATVYNKRLKLQRKITKLIY